MSTLRQLIRSIREKGGSDTMFCFAKTHRSRIDLLIRYWPSSLVKKRLSRSGETSASMLSGYSPARAFSSDIGVAEVGGEDLDRRADRLLVQKLRESDRQRVGFLAGRTSRDPDPDRRPRAFGLEDLREDVALEDLEHLGVAEEAGHVDEDVLVKGLELGAILFEQPSVVRERFLGVKGHAAHGPPPDRRRPGTG